MTMTLIGPRMKRKTLKTFLLNNIWTITDIAFEAQHFSSLRHAAVVLLPTETANPTISTILTGKVSSKIR